MQIAYNRQLNLLLCRSKLGCTVVLKEKISGKVYSKDTGLILPLLARHRLLSAFTELSH